jgi:hypothetical protein
LAYPFRWNELWGLPETGAFAQKCDVPFAALAHPKSNQNPKIKKKGLRKKIFRKPTTTMVWTDEIYRTKKVKAPGVKKT